MTRNHSWRWYAYLLALIGCGQFILLTLLAMLFYPGGTAADPTTDGYTFTQNFFSDLGITETYSGTANPISAALFLIALTVAGLSLIGYFLAFPHFFQQQPSGRTLSKAGSIFGIITGIGYIGVALTPADLLLAPHVAFVYLAFLAFPVATTLYTIAIFRTPTYSNRYAVIFLAFTIALTLYLILLFTGPDMDTANGLTIQATGQKLIVYAALGCMLVQSFGAWRRQTVQEGYKRGEAERLAVVQP
jgi:hypothetical membrane protein